MTRRAFYGGRCYQRGEKSPMAAHRHHEQGKVGCSKLEISNRLCRFRQASRLSPLTSYIPHLIKEVDSIALN